MSGKFSGFDSKTLFFLIVSVLILISAFVIPAKAQENTWQVYLFDSINKAVVVINQDGTYQSFTIGLGENEYISARDIVFDRGGLRAYYCVVNYAQDDSQPNVTTLRVIELGNPRPLYEFNLGDTLGCQVSGIEENANFIAVGVVNYQPFMDGVDPTRPAWQLLLLDPFGGTIIGELNGNDPNMPSLDETGDLAYMPVVQNIGYGVSAEITFIVFPWIGMDGPPSFPAFVWNITEDTLQPVEGWGAFNRDYLPASGDVPATGELVYPAFNESLPYGEPGGPMPFNNIVELRDADNNVTQIYHNPDWVIVDTTFVNNGESVIVTLLESFTMDDNGIAGIRFDLVNRDGTIQTLEALYEDEGFVDVYPVPDGFVIASAEFAQSAGDPPVVYHLFHYPMNAEPYELWTLTPDSSQVSVWEFIWATPFTTIENLPPFTAIAP